MAKCSGKYLSKHPEVVQPVRIALVKGQSLSSVAKEHNISRDAVRAIRDMPETRQFEHAAAARIERIGTALLDKYEEGLAKGKVPLSTMPVAFGILADKRDMLLGENGSPPSEQRGPSVQDILAELRSLPSVAIQMNINQPTLALPCSNQPVIEAK